MCDSESTNIKEYVDSLDNHQKEWLRKYLSTTDILIACPSLKLFVSKLRNEELSADHLQLAQNFCIELAQQRESLFNFVCKDGVSEIPNFTTRISLYKDDIFEIRVHIFAVGASETFIHDHQVRFISYCLQGEYLHKIHSVVEDDGAYYVFTRKSGGIYSKGVKKTGTPMNSVAQPFSAGQCLFISEHAFHTVTPLSKDQVVTITFRDIRPQKHKDSALIINQVNHVENEQQTLIIDDIMRQEEICRQFQVILEHYSFSLVKFPPPPLMEKIEKAIEDTNAMLSQLIHGIQVDPSHHMNLKACICGILFAAVQLGIEIEIASNSCFDQLAGLLSSMNVIISRDELKEKDKYHQNMLRIALLIPCGWFFAGISLMTPNQKSDLERILKESLGDTLQLQLFQKIVDELKSFSLHNIMDMLVNELSSKGINIGSIVYKVLTMRNNKTKKPITRFSK